MPTLVELLPPHSLRRVSRVTPLSLLVLTLVLAMLVITTATPLRGSGVGTPKVLRPERFAAVSVDGFAELFGAGGSMPSPLSAFDVDRIGALKSRVPPQSIPMSSVAEASREFHRPVNVPSELPSSSGEQPRIRFLTPSTATYQIDLPKLQGLMAQYGVGVQLPLTLHGAEVWVTMPAAVEQDWSNGARRLVLIQSRQPSLTVPAELDLGWVRDLALGSTSNGLDPDLVEQLRAVEHWETTMLIPVPRPARSSQVQVGGAEALLVQDPTRSFGMLLWQSRGLTFSLLGNYPEQVLLNVASSLS